MIEIQTGFAVNVEKSITTKGYGKDTEETMGFTRVLHKLYRRWCGERGEDEG